MPCPNCQDLSLDYFDGVWPSGSEWSQRRREWPSPALKHVFETAQHGCKPCSFLVRVIRDYGLQEELINEFDSDRGKARIPEILRGWHVQGDQDAVRELEASGGVKDAEWLSGFCEVNLRFGTHGTMRLVFQLSFSGRSDTQEVEIYSSPGWNNQNIW